MPNLHMTQIHSSVSSLINFETPLVEWTDSTNCFSRSFELESNGMS